MSQYFLISSPVRPSKSKLLYYSVLFTLSGWNTGGRFPFSNLFISPPHPLVWDLLWGPVFLANLTVSLYNHSFLGPNAWALNLLSAFTNNLMGMFLALPPE